jgi:ubiquinol-cytochrome c reductase cytochrome c subunit
MASVRTTSRRSIRASVILPGGLLAIATLSAVAMFFPGVDAGAKTVATRASSASNVSISSHNKGCGNLNLKAVSGIENTGNPLKSSNYLCIDGQVVQYGDSAITYANPPTSYVAAGKLLFDQTCSSCHGDQANGVNPQGKATIGPNLQGVGAATVDFWVSTGRMPASDIKAVEAERRDTRLTDKQALELAAYVNSLDPAAPAVPTPHLKNASLAIGADLFSLNCAACHTITGAGDALAFGTNAPSLQNRSVTPQQVAEAMRIGPANMPRFTGNLSDNQVRDVVAYVTEEVQHPASPGGAGLGGVGPVAEGFVALLIGVGGLALICFWIGERS